ncbi:SCO3242 family prenyltransferase [Streptomyces sp. NPDC085540]|uniref:SCO3242 family prenyltransferase n=1 Tax=Streptomyces sp. NPDC085540 TaxID=3365730 RepID=UPI0037D62D96
MGATGPHPLIELVRAPAALTVPGDVLAGATAAGRRIGPATAGLAGASVCLYWAGMALNDYADREVDAWERSHRPVPSGRVSPRTAFAVATGCTAAGLGLAAVSGGRRSLATAAALAATVWAYDLRLKSTPWGPAAMAVARALDVTLGATAPGAPTAKGPEASARVLARLAVPVAAMAAHTATVTWLSRSEVEGSTPALPAATLAATAAIGAAVALPPGRTRPIGARAATAALAGWYGYRFGVAQAAAARHPVPERIQKAVGAGIHSMVPLQAALIARAGAPGTGLGLAGLLPLARRLSRRVSPT